MKYPSWEDFNQINAGNQRYAFENLCRSLFRLRYNISESLGYFNNHAGNETEVITLDNKVIGFNAKYFDHSIDDVQIIHSIQKARENNPRQTTIIIYTNQEFGNPRKGKDKTATQQKVEDEAEKKDLELEWMYSQNILDAVMKSELLYNVFFNPNDNERYLAHDIAIRNDHILRFIDTEAGGKHINRDEECDTVLNSLQEKKSAILSGCPGVGKSAVLKSIFGILSKTYDIMVLRGDDFSVKNIDDLLSITHHHDLASFVQFYQSVEHKLLVVDAVENVPNLNNNHVFDNFLYELANEGWLFIFTIRDSYINNFDSWIGRNLQSLSYDTVEVKPFSQETFQQYCTENNIESYKIEKIKDLLQIPFYLARFAELGKDGTAESEHVFKTEIWKSKVRGEDVYSPSQQGVRIQTINALVRYCESHHTLRVPEEGLDADAVSQLVNDGVLVRIDETLLTFFHDIYRDWSYEKVIRQDYSTLSSDEFLFMHKGSLAAMFAFSNIVSEQADMKDNHLATIIADAFAGKYPKEWEEQIFAAILKSNYADEFVDIYKTQLLANDCQWIVRLIQILITHCQYIKTYIEYKGKNYPVFVPEGQGWCSVILTLQYVDNKWYLSNYSLLLNMFEVYVRYPNSNAKAFLCVANQLWRFFEINEQSEDAIYIHGTQEKTFHRLICTYSIALKKQLMDMIDRAPSMKVYSKDRFYLDLMEYMATTTDSVSRITLVNSIPDSYIKLIDWFWTAPEEEHRTYGGMMSSENAFGINTNNADHQFFPCSSLQTPVKELFEVHPEKTIEFVIDFFNRCTEVSIQNNYWVDKGAFEAEFLAPNGENRKVLASDNLWNMYRDTSNLAMPDLLKSILMAVENYLLGQCSKKQKDIIHVYLEKILNESNNCALIAVVASIVMAYPDDFIDVALSLFTSAGFFSLDNHRKTHEITALYLNLKYSCHDDMYQERKRANDMRHRKDALEDLCLTFQIVYEKDDDPEIVKRLDRLHEILDKLYDRYNSWSHKKKIQSSFGFLLARLDLRKMKRRVVTLQDGREGVEFLPQLSDSQLRFSQRKQDEAADMLKYPSLGAWAKSEHNNDKRIDIYPYHNSPLDAFKLMNELYNRQERGERLFLWDSQIIPVVAGILVSKFVDKLDNKQTEICVNILEETLANQEFITDSLCDFEVCLSALPFLAEHANTESQLKILADLILPYLQDTSLSCMNTRCCDTIQNIAHSTDFQDKHEELITLLVKGLVSETNTTIVLNEKIADALLCILPFATKKSKWLNLTKSCMKAIAEYFKKLGAERHPHSNIKLANNVGCYIASCDIEYIPMLLEFVKDSLNSGYASSQFFTGIMLQTLSNKYYEKWRLTCDVLLDTIVDLENNRGYSELTPLFMLNPGWIRPEFVNNWYKFNQKDMERIRLFISKVLYRESILLNLLHVVNGIGSDYHIQFLPLIADFIHGDKKLDNKTEVVFQLERFMDSVSKADEVKEADAYNSVVKILNFMISHNSTQASVILNHIKR